MRLKILSFEVNQLNLERLKAVLRTKPLRFQKSSTRLNDKRSVVEDFCKHNEQTSPKRWPMWPSLTSPSYALSGGCWMAMTVIAM
ncbi:hypothetical protein BDQ94DRAFT_149040 [Aspergillus welwitschiae]|uniref:Uncharacterized protein n=1 Tax=Aspergillus welwitschiae TaxID=1341132 RepID=A0A3F3PU20_9EURO|nr:hypothetical protein BDQ94DRAFT_149040 [Aspergillus welwitschiae]RDH30434.1 hypothetical protein BDQ94DRAFT_149040 [Aspergillus welwitschiae]